MNVNESLHRRVALGLFLGLTLSGSSWARNSHEHASLTTLIPAEALLYSTMPSTRDHRPEMAMDGDDTTSFQTTGGMDDGDDFLVLLSRPIPVRSLKITTGDSDKNDCLTNAFVETSPDGVTYTKAGSFDAAGIVDASLKDRSVMVIRIRTNPQSGVPKLIIREISVKSSIPISHVQYGPGRGFIDLSQAPDLTKWAATAEKQMESFWPDTAAILYSYGLITPNMVNVVYKTGPGVTGVAATGGGVMTVNSKWCREHPDDTGLTVHETAHVVQSISASAPGWLIEGTADYIRWVKFEPEHFHPRINVNRATYHDAYQTSATFLGWCTLHYDSQIVTKLNDAARAGQYKNSLFHDYCGKDVDSLWAEFIAAYKADPAHILRGPTTPGMEPRALPSVQAGTSVPVDLSGFFNIRGIQADGAKTDSGGGFDGEGNTFPSAFVAGIKQSKNVSFTLGAAGSTDAIACHANTIPLPSGMHKSLWVLGSSIEGSHKDQTITVTYTDGTTKTYHQNFSDWYVPEAFPGESRAIRSEYRITGDGSRDSRTFFVYSYGFDLIPTKTVQSITLPNDEEIRVLAISLAD